MFVPLLDSVKSVTNPLRSCRRVSLGFLSCAVDMIELMLSPVDTQDIVGCSPSHPWPFHSSSTVA